MKKATFASVLILLVIFQASVYGQSPANQMGKNNIDMSGMKKMANIRYDFDKNGFAEGWKKVSAHSSFLKEKRV